jgi:putative transposase
LRDAEVLALLVAERTHPKTGRLAATLGSRKMWIRLRGEGHEVARCTVERLMRKQGWEGARYGSKLRTTIANEEHGRAPDLVDRDFNPLAPNRLWVADFSYVPTWTGTVYVAFVIDAYARRIIGWRAARSMTTPLVLDALEHAFFTRAQEGVTDLSGLVAHNDAGSQGGFNRSSQHPRSRRCSRWRRRSGARRPATFRRARVGSGVLIGR